MGKGNSSNWISEGSLAGIDLSFLYQDKSKIYEVLEVLGLPTVERYSFRVDDLDLNSLKELFEEDKTYFCRLVPRGKDTIRPYKLNMESWDELWFFLASYNLRDYRELHLVKKEEILYTGSIIARKGKEGVELDRCVVELVEGEGPELFHGLRRPIHAEVRETGTIGYRDREESFEKERRIIYRALKMIGGPKHPFPGYYEFEVGLENIILFRNYQAPESTYAAIPYNHTFRRIIKDSGV